VCGPVATGAFDEFSPDVVDRQAEPVAERAEEADVATRDGNRHPGVSELRAGEGRLGEADATGDRSAWGLEEGTGAGQVLGRARRETVEEAAVNALPDGAQNSSRARAELVAEVLDHNLRELGAKEAAGGEDLRHTTCERPDVGLGDLPDELTDETLGDRRQVQRAEEEPCTPEQVSDIERQVAGQPDHVVAEPADWIPTLVVVRVEVGIGGSMVAAPARGRSASGPTACGRSRGAREGSDGREGLRRLRWCGRRVGEHGWGCRWCWRRRRGRHLVVLVRRFKRSGGIEGHARRHLLGAR
jgi:hypothetical protein